ncbi:MAG: hypothetical protein L6R38_007243 [Xanthoria sp. 2 TBL-2021]|nr:MAG: hypothetical protein L6R38_007243 [Xanthoria sp. 2 TBL-2021]
MAQSRPSIKPNTKPIIIAGTKNRKCELSRSRSQKAPYTTTPFFLKSLKQPTANKTPHKNHHPKPTSSIFKSKSLPESRASKKVTRDHASGLQASNGVVVQDMLQVCARHDNRTEIQEKDIHFLKDMDAVVREFFFRPEEKLWL